MLLQSVQERLGLEQSTTLGCTQAERICSHLNRFHVCVHNQHEPKFPAGAVTELDHFPEFESSIDMKHRKRNRSREKGLLCKTQHDRRILADGIQHRRAGKLRSYLAENMYALRLKNIQVRQAVGLRQFTVIPLCYRQL